MNLYAIVFTLYNKTIKTMEIHAINSQVIWETISDDMNTCNIDPNDVKTIKLVELQNGLVLKDE